MVRHRQFVRESVWTILVFQRISMVRGFSPRWCKSHKPRADQNFSTPQPIHLQIVGRLFINYPSMVWHREIVRERDCTMLFFSGNTLYGDFHLGANLTNPVLTKIFRPRSQLVIKLLGDSWHIPAEIHGTAIFTMYSTFTYPVLPKIFRPHSRLILKLLGEFIYNFSNDGSS